MRIKFLDFVFEIEDEKDIELFKQLLEPVAPAIPEIPKIVTEVKKKKNKLESLQEELLKQISELDKTQKEAKMVEKEPRKRTRKVRRKRFGKWRKMIRDHPELRDFASWLMKEGRMSKLTAMRYASLIHSYLIHQMSMNHLKSSSKKMVKYVMKLYNEFQEERSPLLKMKKGKVKELDRLRYVAEDGKYDQDSEDRKAIEDAIR